MRDGVVVRDDQQRGFGSVVGSLADDEVGQGGGDSAHVRSGFKAIGEALDFVAADEVSETAQHLRHPVVGRRTRVVA